MPPIPSTGSYKQTATHEPKMVETRNALSLAKRAAGYKK